MPLILAIEPDRRQAAQLTSVIRRVGAELVLADTTAHALDAIGSRVPDLVLVPALLSPQDDAALAGALRVIAAAAHVRILTTPVLGSTTKRKSPGGVLAKWRRGAADEIATDGCDPAVFGGQISEYLKEAAAERAEREAAFDPSADYNAPAGDAPETTEQLQAAAPPLEAPSHEELASAIEADSFEPAPAEPIEVEPAIAAPARVDVAVVFEPVLVLPVLPVLIVEPTVLPLVYEEETPAFEAAAEETESSEDIIDLSDQLFDVSADAALKTFFDEEPGEAHAVASAPEEVARTADGPAVEFVDRPITADGTELDAAPEMREFELWMRLSTGAGSSWPRLEGVEAEAAPEVLELEEASVLARPQPVPVVRPPAPAPVVVAAKEAVVVSGSSRTASEAARALKAAAVVARPQPVLPVRPPAPAPIVVAAKPKAVVVSAAVVARPQAGQAIRPPAAPAPIVAAAKPKADVVSAAVVARPQAGQAIRPPAAPAPIVAAAKHQEWLELIDSLRLDVERLRAGRDQAAPVVSAKPKEGRAQAPAPAAKKPIKRAKKPKPVQDEWGFFDPEQCGFAALLAKLEEITDAEESDAGPRG